MVKAVRALFVNAYPYTAFWEDDVEEEALEGKGFILLRKSAQPPEEVKKILRCEKVRIYYKPGSGVAIYTCAQRRMRRRVTLILLSVLTLILFFITS